jgi:hypothetical protein
MTHWGWYWKVKLKHKPKAICQQFSLIAINSFSMFRNKKLVDLVRNSVDRISFKVPCYNLTAVLMPDDSLSVTYNGGSYIIPVEKRVPNYGGLCYYFHCPQCDTRMRILYCNEGKYLCRKCLDLAYYSQRVSPSKRCLLMAGNIKKYLENRGGSLHKRPFRMRQKTFTALCAKYHSYWEDKYVEALQKEIIMYYPKIAAFEGWI